MAVLPGFCKQQLWPLFHYMLPLSPMSLGRFNLELWQAYVKANKVRSQTRLRSVAADHQPKKISLCGLPPQAFSPSWQVALI